MKKLRLGIIGLRNIGRGHVRKAAQLENVEIAALCDLSEERLRMSSDIFSGNPELYREPERFLNDPSVDAIVIALPNHLHADVAIKAMENGKHVLVEKPMARNSAEAEKMIKVRDKTDSVLMVGMNQRFNKLVGSLKKSIDAGRIGNICYAKTRWTRVCPGEGLWERGDWGLSKDNSGGGPMMDIGIHRLDLALYLMGFPEAASVDGSAFYGIGKKEALARNRTYKIEDAGVAFIRLKNGSSMTLEASYFMNDPESGLDTRLYGDKGVATYGEQPKLYLRNGENLDLVEFHEDEEAATSCLEHFCRVLQGREDLVSTPEQGLTGIKIIEAVYESAASGKTIYF